MGPSRTASIAALGFLVPACSLLVSTSDLAGSAPTSAPSAEGGASPPEAGPATPEAGADADAGTIAEPNLVGAWSFDETSGNTSADLSGHGHPAMLIGPSFAPGGVRGGCVQLAGDSGFVSVEDFSAAGFPRTGTFSIWLRWTAMDVDTETQVLEEYTTTLDHLILRHANGDPVGNFQVALQPKGPGAFVWFTGFPIKQNQWSHVVITWDEIAQHAAAYLDGALLDQGAYTVPFAPTDERFHLGAYLAGAIDEVRLYDRALTVKEAKALP